MKWWFSASSLVDSVGALDNVGKQSVGDADNKKKMHEFKYFLMIFHDKYFIYLI